MDPAPPRFLVLLPPVPSPTDTQSLKTAYSDTLAQVLREVATHAAESSRAAILEVALACSHLVGARDRPRASLYHDTQSLLSGLYRLICVTAAQENIDVEDADGVDVRVLLVAWSPDAAPGSPTPLPYNVVVDLETLARSGRAWQYAFGVESEVGEAMVKQFVTAKAGADDGTSEDSESAPRQDESGAAAGPDAPSPESDRHYDVAVGGTFDHLHIGHKLLLTMTLFAVDDRRPRGESRVTIGITGDQLLVNKKHLGLVQSWAERQKAVASFTAAVLDYSVPTSFGQRPVSIQDDPGPDGKSVGIHYPHGLIIRCTEILDPFGPTVTEEQISALVLSGETRSGGRAINDKRKEKGWKALDVFEVDVLNADGGDAVQEGFASKLSSTAIREKLARKESIG